MVELKPCPFCGGEATFAPSSGCSGRVVCIGECGFESNTYWDEPMSEPSEHRRKWYDVIAQMWNRRMNNHGD